MSDAAYNRWCDNRSHDCRSCENLFSHANPRESLPATRRRGSVYVAVLGVAMMVTILGLSALAATRLRRDSAVGTETVVKASLYAQSVVDIVLYRLENDPNWRTTYTHDIWTADEPVGEVTFAYHFVDEADGDLANDPTQPVRLYVKATVGEAVRIASVRLAPPEPVNLLTNPGMEDVGVDWTGTGLWGDCTLDWDTDEPHTGAVCLETMWRENTYGGPSQDVTSKIKNGATYYSEVWIKGDVINNVKSVAIDMVTTNGLAYDNFWAAWSWFEWTKVSGTITPAWTGDLLQAYWHVETDAGTYKFRIDDAVLIEQDYTMHIVPGTWRQEVEG